MSKNAHTVDVSGREHLEGWRVIPEFSGKYEASNLGRIRRRSTGLILKQRRHRKGYPVVELCDGKSRECMVHRMMLSAFHGPAPEGTEGCHNNGVNTDNRIENLRWDTHSSNCEDLVRHGTHRNIRKTECDYGHEYTEANTIYKQGGRTCRECKRIRDAAFYQANKEKWKRTPEQVAARRLKRQAKRDALVDTKVA